MADKILFQTNQSVELALAFLEGKPVEGRFGDQYMYSTVDGRVFYVSVTVGQIIEKQLANLKITVGEPVEIGKYEMDLGKGRKGIQWIVKRVNAPGADMGVPAPVTAVMPAMTNTTSNGNHSKPPSITTGWAQYLLEQTTMLLDVHAAALRYTKEMHGDVISPDDVRSIMITCLINMQKGGQRAA